MRSSEEKFWNGFTAGALAGAAAGAGIGIGATLLWSGARHTHDDRILRVESSIQIARSPQEVFRPLLHLNELPRFSPIFTVVHSERDRSRWSIQYRQHKLRWEMEITEFKPNQAIAWKSLRGPKHTGRINLASVGGETLLMVRLNYVPRYSFFNRVRGPQENLLQAGVEQALRDFKSALETGVAQLGAAEAGGDLAAEMQAHQEPTPAPRRAGETQHSRFGNAELAG